jgi:16S rRNA (cytosine967-C5)-methyltransferase
MTAPARIAAFHALRAVDTGSTELPIALARSRQHLPDERDRGLAAEIVTGTLRWQRALDHLITHFAGRPLSRLDVEVVTILRLSLYQLLHLTRVPASAVVDDAVDLTRAARKPSASGFVNGVLRSVIRQKHRLPFPPRPDDPADRDAALAYLGVTHSHPEWLIARWLSRHGFDDVERWVRFDNEVPHLTLRVNRLRATRDEARRILDSDGIETEPAAVAPDGLVVNAGNPLRRPPDGLFFVQDEASQLVAVAAGVRPGERVLDLCAAPGGKTTAMAAAMHDEGLLLATDVRSRRLRLLQDTVRLSGARNTRIVQVPARGALPFAGRFDCVLVDAPCSGLGTIRRDPDIRWRRREEDLTTFAMGQVDLLDRAALTLRTGGRLVYATCSSEPDENEDVVDQFLGSHPAFSLSSLADHPLLGRFTNSRGMMRTLPFAHGLEAFFAAVLVAHSSDVR